MRKLHRRQSHYICDTKLGEEGRQERTAIIFQSICGRVNVPPPSDHVCQILRWLINDNFLFKMPLLDHNRYLIWHDAACDLSSQGTGQATKVRVKLVLHHGSAVINAGLSFCQIQVTQNCKNGHVAHSNKCHLIKVAE